MAKISVIIPLYNRSGLISETLNSLAPSLHPGVDLEVIVVDDGSDDGGDELVRNEYPWVILLKQKNSGAPVARNRGLSEARGEFVLFFDSDDLIEPNFFNEKVSCLKKNPDAVAAYGPWEHFYVNQENKKIIVPRHSAYGIEAVPEYQSHLKNLLGGWYIICHAILWRKSILNILNGYDPLLPVNQDVDLLFRALVKKSKIIGVPSPLALYRDHQDPNRTGTLSLNDSKLHSVLELRKKFASELRNENLLNDANRKSLAAFCFNYWAKYRKTNPVIAEEFFQLSKELDSKIKVNGSLIYKWLGNLAGAKNAVILKSLIK